MRTERIGNATLILGDCLEILPTLDMERAAIVTDQPYGTGWVRGGGAVGEFNAKHERPDWDVFDLSWLRLIPAWVGVATFSPPSRLPDTCSAFARPCVARYRKTNVRPGGNDREYIVANSAWSAAEWEVEAYNGDCPFHPCQKPIAVMQWVVVNLGGFARIIVDPFMGSGSTGVAALGLSRQFVGIERDPAYFQIACERIENAQRQQSLLLPESPRATTANLLDGLTA